MKFIIAIVTGIILTYFSQQFLPWWIFAVCTFLISLFIKYNSGWVSFCAGFLIVFITWMILYIIKNNANDSVLSNKMATLFNLPSGYILFFAASAVMAIIGGLTAVAGNSLLKNNFFK